ncbi:MAG: glycosyltransferase N-terminal domain-containing protein [Parvularculaceae bacterium]
MLKRIMKSAFAARLASWLIGIYIRLVHATSRWTFVGREHFETAEVKGKGVILTFWHSRLMMAATVRNETDRRVYMLVSAHRDGEIIANGVKSFGIEFIRGSASDPKKRFKNKNGAPALAQMIAALKEGAVIGITPDGPRGPAMKAQFGVVKLSLMSGAPILPAAYSTSRGRFLKTWDMFLLAAPFSRGYYVAGPPIEAPENNDSKRLEEKRLELERALNRAAAEADRLAGRRSPAPEAAPTALEPQMIPEMTEDTTFLSDPRLTESRRRMPGLQEPLGLRFYRAASRAAEPVASLALHRRMKAGKEDPARIRERRGIAGRARPEGALVWIHGASVGESLSVLPLVERLRERRPELQFLVTTGTVTSARLMNERLPPGAVHQFIPLDHPRYVASFLDHWRPQAAFFVESEFWPNLIVEARRRVQFMAVVNGRVSPKSFEGWTKRPRTIKYLLSAFDLIMAQDHQNAERLETLSGVQVLMFGNLKNAAPPLPANDSAFEELCGQIEDRQIWLAASTHPGEEEIVFSAHNLLKPDFPRVLTFNAPRHPERGDEVAALAAEAGLCIARRSKKEPITPSTDVYLADTLGELGLFYRLNDIAFVGGGLNPKGGHNPLEPARLGTAILHGPHTFNFVETYGEMRSAGGAALIRNDRELATAVRRLLSDDKTRNAMAETAGRAAGESAERVLAEICDALLAQMPEEAHAS